VRGFSRKKTVLAGTIFKKLIHPKVWPSITEMSPLVFANHTALSFINRPISRQLVALADI